MEHEAEVKSVYVRNVPTRMAASEIGEEFKKFGKLKPNGVAIRNRKDIDICYAFVEFEDISEGAECSLRYPWFRLVHTNSTLKGGDRIEITPFDYRLLKANLFQQCLNRPPPEWQHIPETPSQRSVASLNIIERSGIETQEETSAMEHEVEVKSVYVRNVPTRTATSEIGEDLKKFGKCKADGVAIRTRKDIDVCYAFVEFEDISEVQNAIKIGAHQLYIEGQRPNRNNSI